jgi:soluble lytic murein transglycosylase-like protein
MMPARLHCGDAVAHAALRALPSENRGALRLQKRVASTYLALLFAIALLTPSTRVTRAEEAQSAEHANAAAPTAQPASLATASPTDLDPPLQNPGGATIDPAMSPRALVKVEAARAGMPAEIADAVMGVESGYDPNVIGAAGEIGLMQVLPSTARMMGFTGTASDLAVPATNIHYGVTYLAEAWQLAGHDLCTAVMKYRAGHNETRFSYLSVDYCVRVRAKLAARGYFVGGTVPVPTFGEPTAGCRRCGALKRGGPDLAALNSRLTQIVLQVSTFKPTGH